MRSSNYINSEREKLKITDDVILLSIATFTLFPIYVILQNSTLI